MNGREYDREKKKNNKKSSFCFFFFFFFGLFFNFLQKKVLSVGRRWRQKGDSRQAAPLENALEKKNESNPVVAKQLKKHRLFFFFSVFFFFFFFSYLNRGRGEGEDVEMVFFFFFFLFFFFFMVSFLFFPLLFYLISGGILRTRLTDFYLLILLQDEIKGNHKLNAGYHAFRLVFCFLFNFFFFFFHYRAHISQQPS